MKYSTQIWEMKSWPKDLSIEDRLLRAQHELQFQDQNQDDNPFSMKEQKDAISILKMTDPGDNIQNEMINNFLMLSDEDT